MLNRERGLGASLVRSAPLCAALLLGLQTNAALATKKNPPSRPVLCQSTFNRVSLAIPTAGITEAHRNLIPVSSMNTGVGRLPGSKSKRAHVYLVTITVKLPSGDPRGPGLRALPHENVSSIILHVASCTQSSPEKFSHSTYSHVHVTGVTTAAKSGRVTYTIKFTAELLALTQANS